MDARENAFPGDQQNVKTRRGTAILGVKRRAECGKDIGAGAPANLQLQGGEPEVTHLRTALFGMGGTLLAAGGLWQVPAQASDYPSKPIIQLVSSYGAGGDPTRRPACVG